MLTHITTAVGYLYRMFNGVGLGLHTTTVNLLPLNVSDSLLHQEVDIAAISSRLDTTPHRAHVLLRGMMKPGRTMKDTTIVGGHIFGPQLALHDCGQWVGRVLAGTAAGSIALYYPASSFSALLTLTIVSLHHG